MARKSTWKKVWHFIWEEDSLASWLVNLVLAFIIIKYLVYPGIGFALGTSHPIVAVVSGSMEHKTVHPCIPQYFDPITNICNRKDESIYQLCDKSYSAKHRVDLDFFWQSCGDYYEQKGIIMQEFTDFDFKNGFNTGDIMILKGSDPSDIEVGDVIVFYAAKNYPIIHRVIEKRSENNTIYFTTKGDHNQRSDPVIDTNISQDRVIGKAFIRIPYLGWIKIAAFKMLDAVGLNRFISAILN